MTRKALAGLSGFVLVMALAAAGPGHAGPADQQDADLAKQLANPIASLISVPFQFNYDFDVGPNDAGQRLTVNVQPVVPIPLNDDWNMIVRTIVPIISQEDIFPGAGSQSGLGDTTQSFFFSPKRTGPDGIVWGVGPAFLYPTGTDALLGSGKWGAGPTAVALKQSGGWTVGMLANQIWSFAGDPGRPTVSNAFLQPFLSYTTKDEWTFSLTTETNYNWNATQQPWSVPIIYQVSKLVKFGTQPISLQAGLKYWAVSPDSGPHGLSARFAVTALFPSGG